MRRRHAADAEPRAAEAPPSRGWLRWDVEQRRQIRAELAAMYNAEAHKAIPEILAQQLLLSRLDADLWHRSLDAIDALIALDAEFGAAVVRSDGNPTIAVGQITELAEKVDEVGRKLQKAFSGNTR